MAGTVLGVLSVAGGVVGTKATTDEILDEILGNCLFHIPIIIFPWQVAYHQLRQTAVAIGYAWGRCTSRL